MEVVAYNSDNTLRTLRHALQDGAQILALDVHATQDEIIVVCQQPVWHGKKVLRTPYELLAQGLLKFEEVLLALPHVRLNIHIKPKDLQTAYLTVDLIRKHNATSRVCLTSYHWEVHRWLDDLHYEGERGISGLETLFLFFMPSAWIRTRDWAGRRAQVPLKASFLCFSNSFFINKCHRLGIWVDYWVINQLQIALKLQKLGADRVITEHPATLASLSSA